MRILTTQNLDADGMQVVLCPDERAHTNDKEIPKAGDKCHDPDRDTQDYTGQQVFKRGEAVRVGLAFPDMRSVGAVLKFLEVSREMLTEQFSIRSNPKLCDLNVICCSRCLIMDGRSYSLNSTTAKVNCCSSQVIYSYISTSQTFEQLSYIHYTHPWGSHG